MRARTHFLRTASLLILSAAAASTHAATMTYDNEADFTTAIAGLSSNTIDFDSATAGDLVLPGSPFDGVTFDYSLDYDLSVDATYDTTSSSNYLGINDFDGRFAGGDSFDMTFGSAQSAIGLYIHIGFESLLFDNDITLTTNTGLVANLSANADQQLLDGEAYFIGLYSDSAADAFTSVSFSSFPEDYYFNVDDITFAQMSSPPGAVSEPSSLILLSLALGGLIRLRKSTC
ncbi:MULTISPECIES: PEP-CTERM sorting domain-containing protein [unclassified Oleiphilus]|nr:MULTISPECIES: PEP-CTERM sorting domain-containing protein [unclassified Oleiphilus]